MSAASGLWAHELRLQGRTSSVTGSHCANKKQSRQRRHGLNSGLLPHCLLLLPVRRAVHSAFTHTFVLPVSRDPHARSYLHSRSPAIVHRDLKSPNLVSRPPLLLAQPVRALYICQQKLHAGWLAGQGACHAALAAS